MYEDLIDINPEDFPEIEDVTLELHECDDLLGELNVPNGKTDSY